MSGEVDAIEVEDICPPKIISMANRRTSGKLAESHVEKTRLQFSHQSQYS